jgi:hypothetical protein
MRFGARALTIKSWSALLIAGGVGVGLKEHSDALIIATIIAALRLWLIEAIWKSFQYCHTDRIKLIEAWFRAENREIVPFQIFSAWGVVWGRWYKRPKIIDPHSASTFRLSALSSAWLIPNRRRVELPLVGRFRSSIPGDPTAK